VLIYIIFDISFQTLPGYRVIYGRNESGSTRASCKQTLKVELTC
jgi:hypothetical protein